MRVADLYLLSAVAEPKARKTVARAYGLPSGAVPVLAAVAFKAKQGESTRPRELYEANLGTETFIRSHVRVLVKAQLLEKRTAYRTRFLRLTPQGMLAIGVYERAIQEGCVAFGQIRPMRVLTSSLPMN